MSSPLHFFIRLFLVLAITSILFTIVNAAPPVVAAQAQPAAVAPVPGAAAVGAAVPAAAAAPVAPLFGNGVVGGGALSVSPATMSL